MKRFVYPLCILAVLMLPHVASSEPMDSDAANLLLKLKDAWSRDKDHQLSEPILASVIDASRSDGFAVREVAAYALAFTDLKAGQQALAALESDRNPSVAATARFSVAWKQASRLKGPEFLSVLSFNLGRSDHAWTRTLLVTRMGDEFKSATVPLFLTALKVEKNSLTRAEMFFQIACYGNATQLGTVRSFLQEEKATLYFADAEAFFLNAISRAPVERESEFPLEVTLNEMIDSRLKAMNAPPANK